MTPKELIELNDAALRLLRDRIHDGSASAGDLAVLARLLGSMNVLEIMKLKDAKTPEQSRAEAEAKAKDLPFAPEADPRARGDYH